MFGSGRGLGALSTKIGWDKAVSSSSIDDEDELSNAFTAASANSSEDGRANLSASIRRHDAVLQDDALEGIDHEDLVGKPLHTLEDDDGQNYETTPMSEYNQSQQQQDIPRFGPGNRRPNPSNIGGRIPVKTPLIDSNPNFAPLSESDEDTFDFPPPKPLRGAGGAAIPASPANNNSAGRPLLGGTSSDRFVTRSQLMQQQQHQQQHDPSAPDPRWGSNLEDTYQGTSQQSISGNTNTSKSILRNKGSKWNQNFSRRGPMRIKNGAGDDYTVDVSDDGRSKVSFTHSVSSRFTSAEPLKSSTKARVILALLCLTASVLLSLFYGSGSAGLWMSNRVVSTSVGVRVDDPGAGRIPGSLGPAPAYNGTFDIPDLKAMNIILPNDMEHYQDWTIPFPARNRTEIPVLWTIPRAGGSVVIRILAKCFGLVQVSGEGANHFEPQLQILETPQGTRYLNVDSTSISGLVRAKDLELAESGMAEVVYTHLIPEAAMVFSLTHRGRLFSMFRHPLERAVSLYYQKQVLDPAVTSMTLAEFANTRLPNNELTRTLVSKGPTEDLSQEDLFLAMEILRRKCVVGLSDRIGESMERFYNFFGWKSFMVRGVEQCESDLLAPNTARPPSPTKGSEAYTFILAQNRYDVRLFEYAQYLFDFQGGSS